MVETKTYLVFDLDKKQPISKTEKKMLIVYEDQLTIIKFEEIKQNGITKIKL
jgi:hypothetical protein